MAMSDDDQIDLLRDSWLSYLLKQSHDVAGEPESIIVIRSRNGKRKPYRWLLMTSDEPARVFRIDERRRLRSEIARATRSREKPFVVVGFSREPRRIVAIPAPAALAAGVVRSDRGGIVWED